MPITEAIRRQRITVLRILFAQAIERSKEPGADPKRVTEWLVGELHKLRAQWEEEDPPWDEPAGEGERVTHGND